MGFLGRRTERKALKLAAEGNELQRHGNVLARRAAWWTALGVMLAGTALVFGIMTYLQSSRPDPALDPERATPVLSASYTPPDDTFWIFPSAVISEATAAGDPCDRWQELRDLHGVPDGDVQSIRVSVAARLSGPATVTAVRVTDMVEERPSSIESVACEFYIREATPLYRSDLLLHADPLILHVTEADGDFELGVPPSSFSIPPGAQDALVLDPVGSPGSIYSFRLEVDIVVDGAELTVVLDNQGEPFRFGFS